MILERSVFTAWQFLFILSATGFVSAFVTFQLLLSRNKITILLSQKNHPAFTGSQTPQVGGLVIFLITFIVLVINLAFVGFDASDKKEMGILAFVALTLPAMALGLWDDFRPTSPLLRLVCQTALSIIAIYFLVNATGLDTNSSLFGVVPMTIVVALGIPGIIWTMNSTNFIDGMDLAVMASIFPGLMFLTGILVSHETNPIIHVFSVVLCGSFLAFAWFNKPVAKAYLGDAGSLALGFVAACLIIFTVFKFGTLSGLLPFSYLFTDSISTLWARIRRRENIFQSHASHAYQSARKNGQPALLISWKIFLVSLFCTALAAIAFAQRGNPAIELAAFFTAIFSGILLVQNLRSAEQSSGKNR